MSDCLTALAHIENMPTQRVGICHFLRYKLTISDRSVLQAVDYKMAFYPVVSTTTSTSIIAVYKHSTS